MLLSVKYRKCYWSLAAKLAEKGVTNIKMYDVSNTHVSYLISDTFKYSHLVLASPHIIWVLSSNA